MVQVFRGSFAHPSKHLHGWQALKFQRILFGLDGLTLRVGVVRLAQSAFAMTGAIWDTSTTLLAKVVQPL